MNDGTIQWINDDNRPAPGDTIQIIRSEFAGYYRVIRTTERDGKPVYDLLPEDAWEIADPVNQRSHRISLSLPVASARTVGEHAPVCRTCGKLWPCTHVKNIRQLDQDIQDLEEQERKRHRARGQRRRFRARYLVPGVCPACQKPVTFGQPSQTFDTNAIIKNGPPVTFHVSRKCGIDTRHHSMHDYQQRLKKQEQS